MNFATSLPVLLLATVGICLPTPRARRRALAGPLLLSLSYASLRVALGPSGSIAALPVSYTAVTAALMLIALALPIGFAIVALRDPAWAVAPKLLAITASLGALFLGLRTALPLATDGIMATVTAAAALLLLGILLRLTGPRLAAGLRWVDAVLFPVRAPSPYAWDRIALWLLVSTVAAAALACLTPRLDLLFLGVALGVVTGLLLERRVARLTRLPLLTPIALVILGAAAYLMIQIAGDTSLTLRGLIDAPYSPAFELLAVLLLGITAWILLGLFPFASVSAGLLSPFFAGVLVARIAGPVLPTGWAHWQPLFYVIPALAASHAAATRRDRETLVALATLGLLSESVVAAWCGLALVAGAALVHAIDWPTAVNRRINGRGEFLLRLLIVLAAPLLVPLLQGALEAQAVYTVVTVIGVIGSLFGTRIIRAR